VSLSQPASVVIGALLTAGGAIAAAWWANRKARPNREAPDVAAWRKQAGQLLDLKDEQQKLEMTRADTQHQSEVDRLIKQYEGEIQYLRNEVQQVRAQLNATLADLAAARAAKGPPA
jgi:hypothetical protein